MNISLTPELEHYIKDKIAGGMYHSASEVVREALRLLRRHDELARIEVEELRREIQLGLDDLDQGRKTVFDESALEGIKSRGRERLAREQRPPLRKAVNE
jgi:antitoxin ParD1/3/4